MSWRILVFNAEPEASMNYFDSDMSKSTKTVIYFEWKTLFLFTFAECVADNSCCQIRADDNSSTCTCTFMTGACANEIIITRLITRFYNKAKKDVMLEYLIFLL